MTQNGRFVAVIVALTALVLRVSGQAQTTEIDALQGLAEQGDAQAQFTLGAMYYNGRGVPQDYKQAVKWYRLAAEQGFVAF